MIALGNGLVNGRAVLDMVPFKNSDLVEKIGENTSGHQSGHAPADNYGSFTEKLRHCDPLKLISCDRLEKGEKRVVSFARAFNLHPVPGAFDNHLAVQVWNTGIHRGKQSATCEREH